jgi:hypothetical protein
MLISREENYHEQAMLVIVSASYLLFPAIVFPIPSLEDVFSQDEQLLLSVFVRQS